METETKVTIISTPQGFNEDELYVDLEPLFGRSLFLKGMMHLYRYERMVPDPRFVSTAGTR